LTNEKPIRLPDNRIYCAACCEGMAADDFEMETGEPFVQWIEKHPILLMRHQPLELSVRRMIFFLSSGLSVMGLLVLVCGLLEMCLHWRGLGTGSAAALSLTGGAMMLLFGYVALRGARAFLRARRFLLTLSNGVFHLQHGEHSESFSADDITQASIVRPGAVGAAEGALRLKDGRALTLDSCLSDLHALGVVMDLRFRNDFPPSADELARARREKLRKIRGLS
jgi:hypothetical protein